MTMPASRRSFLRSLTTLPLIGCSVTLIGAPTAVAEPVTPAMMAEYETWLGLEQRRVALELGRTNHVGVALYGAAYDWHYGGLREGYRNGPTSSRAALVLATVGCDWRRDG